MRHNFIVTPNLFQVVQRHDLTRKTNTQTRKINHPFRGGESIVINEGCSCEARDAALNTDGNDNSIVRTRELFVFERQEINIK
jgi:hypothetical protein